MQLFFVLVLTHFISDFMLQGNIIGIKKYGLNIYMLTHVAIISLSALLPLLIFQIPLATSLRLTSLIFLTHLVIDVIRSYANRRLRLSPDKYGFWVSLGLDQILHVGALYALVTNL